MQQTALDVAHIMGHEACEAVLCETGARHAKLGIKASTSDTDVQWLARRVRAMKHAGDAQPESREAPLSVDDAETQGGQADA